MVVRLGTDQAHARRIVSDVVRGHGRRRRRRIHDGRGRGGGMELRWRGGGGEIAVGMVMMMRRFDIKRRLGRRGQR